MRRSIEYALDIKTSIGISPSEVFVIVSLIDINMVLMGKENR